MDATRLVGKLCALSFLISFFTSCGGGSSTPTAPTPAPTTRVINVTGNLSFGQVTVGNSQVATMTISNSGNAALTVTGIDVPDSIVSQLTASWTRGQIVAGGSQTVTLIYSPTTATSITGTVTVLADQTGGSNTLAISATAVSATPFSGNWSGNYIVERCEGTGSARELTCAAPENGRPGGAYPVGSSLSISMELSQSGTTVSGTIAFGQIRGVVTGVVSPSTGLLTLQGTALPPSGGGSITITYWQTRVQQTLMDGFFNFDLRLPTSPGVASVYNRLGTVRK